jgi:hypothetical protein
METFFEARFVVGYSQSNKLRNLHSCLSPSMLIAELPSLSKYEMNNRPAVNFEIGTKELEPRDNNLVYNAASMRKENDRGQ